MIPAAQSERRVGAAVAAVLGVLVLAPAGVVIAASFVDEGRLTLAAYAPLWESSRPWRLMWNSFCVAGGTALVAAISGTLFAVLVHSVRPLVGRVLLALGAIPLLIPPYIAATAWIEWAGRRGVIRTVVMGAQPGEGEWFSLYGPGGAIAVLAASYFPVVLFFAWAAMARVRRSLAEAGWVHMHPRRVLWRVVLPNARGGIATGTFIVFMIALANYSVPSLLLIEVYPVEVHTQFSAFYDAPRATAAALPLLLLAAMGALLWRLALAGHEPVPWQAPQSPPRYRAGVGIVPLTATLVAIAVSVVAPLAVLASRAGSWKAYVNVLSTAHDELWSSLVLSAACASLLAVCGWGVAVFVHTSATMRWTSRALLAPFVLSGPLFGIGLILMYNHAGIRALVFDSMWIVVLACVARYLFFASQAGAAALHAVPSSLLEAAAVSGHSWWRRYASIAFPLTAHWAVAAWGVSFVLVFGEADAIVLVAPPGFTPLPARLHSLMHYGPSAYVAALSIIVVTILGVAAAATGAAYAVMYKVMHERYRHS